MAYEEMAVVEGTTSILGGKRAREYEATLAGAGNSEWVLIPDSVTSIVVTVTPTTATAKVQTTSDLVETVKTGSPIAVDWDLGAVSVASQDEAGPVTAMRLVQIGVGSSIMTMRAQ